MRQACKVVGHSLLLMQMRGLTCLREPLQCPSAKSSYLQGKVNDLWKAFTKYKAAYYSLKSAKLHILYAKRFCGWLHSLSVNKPVISDKANMHLVVTNVLQKAAH